MSPSTSSDVVPLEAANNPPLAALKLLGTVNVCVGLPEQGQLPVGSGKETNACCRAWVEFPWVVTMQYVHPVALGVVCVGKHFGVQNPFAETLLDSSVGADHTTAPATAALVRTDRRSMPPAA